MVAIESRYYCLAQNAAELSSPSIYIDCDLCGRGATSFDNDKSDSQMPHTTFVAFIIREPASRLTPARTSNCQQLANDDCNSDGRRMMEEDTPWMPGPGHIVSYVGCRRVNWSY